MRKTISQLFKESEKSSSSKRLVCAKCESMVEKGWVVCPNCGTPVKDMKKHERLAKKGRRWLRESEEDELDAIDDVESEMDEDVGELELPDDESDMVADDEETQDGEAVTVDEVIDAVKGLVGDSGIELTNQREKVVLGFDLTAEDGSGAQVFYDGKAVSVYTIDTDELVASVQAESIPEMIEALGDVLSSTEEGEDTDQDDADSEDEGETSGSSEEATDEAEKEGEGDKVLSNESVAKKKNAKNDKKKECSSSKKESCGKKRRKI